MRGHPSSLGIFQHSVKKKCPEKNKHIAQYIKTNSQPLLLFFMSPRIVSEFLITRICQD